MKRVPLRQIRSYVAPRVRTHYGKTIRVYYIPSVFNELPDDVFALTSRKRLKAAVQALQHL